MRLFSPWIAGIQPTEYSPQAPGTQGRRYGLFRRYGQLSILSLDMDERAGPALGTDVEEHISPARSDGPRGSGDLQKKKTARRLEPPFQGPINPLRPLVAAAEPQDFTLSKRNVERSRPAVDRIGGGAQPGSSRKFRHRFCI